MLRALAFVQKEAGISPGQRFRLEQWAPHLERDHGVSLELAPFESAALTSVLYERGRHAEKAGLLLRDFARRALDVARARRYDVVIMYREAALLGPAFYEYLLRGLGIPTIVDFDDAIWLHEATGPNGVFARLRFPKKIATICRLSSVVTVGNLHLAEWARVHNPRTHVVPTTIELGAYRDLPPPPADGQLVIGWTGSLSTLRYLETARGAIERVAAARPTRVEIVCSHPPSRPFAGAETHFVPWRAQTEALDVARFGVGIMPVPDEPVGRGKCGCKALQYMAAERPVVLSPVGVNADIVQDGENGIFATTENEWVEALLRLGDSAELRAKLARAGRRTVEQGFSAEAGAAKLARAVRDAIATRPR